MNSAEDLLDELCYHAGELPISAGRGGCPPPEISCRLATAESQRGLQLASPYFTRDFSPRSLGAAWLPFCQLLRQHGVLLFSPASHLEQVPAAAVPARASTHFINQPLDPLEITTADAIEIACADDRRRSWAWSCELSPSQLPDFLSAVRQAAGGDTPVGVGLPADCHAADIHRVLHAGVDFISLTSRSRRGEVADIYGLVQCRRLACQAGRSALPILIAVPVSDIDRAHKLLALGATAVSLDGLLQPLLAAALRPSSSSELGGGLLSGLAPAATRKSPTLGDVAAAVGGFQTALRERLQAVGVSRLADFTGDSLRSCSPQSELLTAVPPLRFAQVPSPG